MTPLSSDVKMLKDAIVGPDLRGGMAADITTMKGDIILIKKYINGSENETKKKGRDWRLLGFSIIASIVSGLTVVAVSYAVHLFG